MVKTVTYTEKQVVGLRASSVGLFVGTLWSIVGLGVAILHSLRGSVAFAQETQSILTGLAFGVVAGFVSIIVVPIVYFGLGWIVGYVHGWIFNVISEKSGGIEVKLADIPNKK